MALGTGPQGQNTTAGQYTVTTTSGNTFPTFPQQLTATPNVWQPVTCFPSGTDFDIKSVTDTICLAAGHQMGDEIEVGDEFIFFCDRCGARLVLKSLPGGMSFQRIKALLTNLAAGEDISEDTLGEFLTLKNQLAEEAEALELAATMLSQAAEIVKAKGALDSDPS